MSNPHVTFIDGPISGIFDLTEIQPYMVRSSVQIPVNTEFKLGANSPFALAVYEPLGIPGAQLYSFRKFIKCSDGPFMVDFVGGPLDGTRPFHQPVPGLSGIVPIPIASKPAASADKKRLRISALYKPAVSAEGKFQLEFLEERRDLVDTPRIIFEMTAGPYDGVTYDSDAEMVDREFHSWAAGHYYLTVNGRKGERFMLQAPQFRIALETFGRELVQKFGGPYPPHMYEVVDKLEDGLEVYVIAKYVGLWTGNSQSEG